MKTKQYTIQQFADKVKKTRSTIWRWCTVRGYEKYFKMYDAKKIKIAGKYFVEQTIEK